MRKGKNKSVGRRKFLAIGYGSLALLGLVGMALLFPVVGGSSSALGEDVTLSSSLNTKTTAYLYSTIALSTSGEIDINLVPKSNGALEVGTADVAVATNNTTGYSILLSTVDQTNKLNQKDKNAQYAGSTEDYAIEALPNKVTKANYLNNTANLNTWGYALTVGQANENTEYRGLSTSTGETIYSTNGTSSRDSYKLNVAVAADTSLPAGGYQNGLIVTAVANPIIISGFNQIYYMQDMTPAICESAEMESTARLVDKRDNRLYTVTKFKDGNCWLTDNLNFVITDEMANATGENGLSSETTDIGYDDNGNLIDGIKYWNQDSPYPPVTTTSSNAGYLDDGDTAASWSVNTNYRNGALYTFGAATAGSGVELSSGNAPDSICPKGWKIPVRGTYINKDTEVDYTSIDKSYTKLFYLYGALPLASSDNQQGIIDTPPLNFYGGGQMRESGQSDGGGGYRWTPDVTGRNSASSMYIAAKLLGGRFGQFNSGAKRAGNTINCVAR